MQFYRQTGKRILDVAVGLASLPFVAAIGCGVAIAIKIDDAGPVLYKSTRRGLYGRPFTMVKFRTMHVDAADLRNADGSTVNSANDKRVTRVGRILRNSSIDELPQVFNVIRGDMSIVGPRPNMYSTPYHQLSLRDRTRITVRPGITGFSQAKFRNSVDSETKIDADIEYISQISFTFDVRIIVMTVASVLRAKNINQSESVFQCE